MIILVLFIVLILFDVVGSFFVFLVFLFGIEFWHGEVGECRLGFVEIGEGEWGGG